MDDPDCWPRSAVRLATDFAEAETAGRSFVEWVGGAAHGGGHGGPQIRLLVDLVHGNDFVSFIDADQPDWQVAASA